MLRLVVSLLMGLVFPSVTELGCDFSVVLIPPGLSTIVFICSWSCFCVFSNLSGLDS